MRYRVLSSAALALVVMLSSCNKIGDYDYRIMVNYELGMHCTGFDFSYCCILPPYNSIQAQVVKVGVGTQAPRLLDRIDPNDPSLLVDPDNGRRFRIRYEIVDNSFSEGGKLVYWKAPFDMNRNGNPSDSGESVANAYFSHLYIFKDLEGSNPKQTSLDAEKKYVGGPGLEVPEDAGPTGQKLSGFLRNSGPKGTVVFTKSPVLDNTPIMLTNPGIWEALGLPLTPFLDSEIAGRDVKKVTEKSVQPYQVGNVTLVDADTGKPILDSKGQEVHFTGTNPIDVPNCSNCHSNENVNGHYPAVFERVKSEKNYWKSVGASDWYAEQKATSISILSLHDLKHGTRFTEKYNLNATSNRLGRGAVLCQKCHADNVIGVLGAGTVVHRKDGTVVVEDRARIDLAAARGTPVDYLDPKNPNVPKDGIVIMPLSEAIHSLHLKVRPLPDGQMRSGSCQGCHPAHRYDRDMTGYPITADGRNAYSGEPGSIGNDNRDAHGGCYARRDVHSNPDKDKELPGRKPHLNAVGLWLQESVARRNGQFKGLWCTNCHNDVSKELYKSDRLEPGEAFHPNPDHSLRGKSLEEIAQGLHMSVADLTAQLDPKVRLDPTGHDRGSTNAAWRTAAEGRVTASIGVVATDGKNPIVSKDADGDVSVKLVDMNPNLVAAHQSEKGVAPPYDAATQGRDYWISPGVPHCADCHSAPFVEGQGGMAYPINQPGKYSSMRYTKGHAGLSCQACHESIHGLYPVSPDVDQTTYHQAEQLNPDGSHGPLKCGTCHKDVNANGVPLLAAKIRYKGRDITDDFDLAVEWIPCYRARSGRQDDKTGQRQVVRWAERWKRKTHSSQEGDYHAGNSNAASADRRGRTFIRSRNDARAYQIP